MRVVIRRLLVVAVLASGCARKREAAPAEMEEIASFMLRVWDDDRALEDAMVNLAPWLEENSTAEDAQDGYRLTPLSEESVSTLDRPDRDLSGLLGAAVAGVSPFTIHEHAGTALLPDQVFSNPRNYESYVRTVEGDEALFLDCEGQVDTTNDITTSNFGVTIPYVLRKDYKWVHARDLGEAIIARSWIPEKGCNESGENCLQQSFSIDLWYAAVPDETIRFTSTWSEVTSSLDGLIGEDLQIAALANGMAFVFEATDEFIAEQ
ncbi:MAG: hypothetical protein H6737_13620 [Alphaproteobacteria bacterium]|nr:hypothetical protein [Alphaproteobacteria bacterium]